MDAFDRQRRLASAAGFTGIGILLVLKPAGNVVAKERQRTFA